jgi:sugar lactone lactonase YvrE
MNRREFCLYAGFALHAGGTTLAAEETAAELFGWMYWTHGVQGIYRAARDGTEIERIIEGPRINAIAVDPAGGKLFWNVMTEPARRRGEVWSAGLDGANARRLAKDLHWLADIVVDPVDQKLYVASLGDGKIVRLDCEGARQEDFLADLPPPRQLAVDLENRQLYWSSNSQRRIDRIRLDGSGRTQALGEMPGTAFGMALDLETQVIYWASPRGVIFRSSLDGTRHEKLIEGLQQPDGLAIDRYSRLIYWTENGKLSQANLDSGDRQTLVAGKTTQYSSIEVFPPE